MSADSVGTPYYCSKIAFYWLLKARFLKETGTIIAVVLWVLSSKMRITFSFFFFFFTSLTSSAEHNTRRNTSSSKNVIFHFRLTSSIQNLFYWSVFSRSATMSSLTPRGSFLDSVKVLLTHTGESSSPTCQTNTASLSQLLHTHSHGLNISHWPERQQLEENFLQSQ